MTNKETFKYQVIIEFEDKDQADIFVYIILNWESSVGYKDTYDKLVELKAKLISYNQTRNSE